MKYALSTAALVSLAAASPQWGGSNGNNGPWANGAGPFAAFPSCVSGCRNNQNWNDGNSLCKNDTAVTDLNNCINSSSCDDSDKNSVRQAVAQLCANAGASITEAPFASYSVTSGESPSALVTNAPPAQWSSWASEHSLSNWPTASSDWSSWASANGWRGGPGPGPGPVMAAPTGDWTSAASAFSSWTAANTITSFPTAASQWSSFTSAHPLPSDLSSFGDWVGANGFQGGSAWPTAWTTNSAWASAISAWDNGDNNGNGGPFGWHGGAGPFGPGGMGGWGNGPWASGGAWTSGPWTNWWGTNGCPSSTWSGWTDGPWGTSAPWTTWTGCTATTTASHVYTTTISTNGGQITTESTSFGIKVAEATGASSSSASSGSTSNSNSGAMPTNMAFVGSAAGVVGVIAGAVLL